MRMLQGFLYQRIIDTLEKLILLTPTGVAREKLTEANILIQSVKEQL